MWGAERIPAYLNGNIIDMLLPRRYQSLEGVAFCSAGWQLILMLSAPLLSSLDQEHGCAHADMLDSWLWISRIVCDSRTPP